MSLLKKIFYSAIFLILPFIAFAHHGGGGSNGLISGPINTITAMTLDRGQATLGASIQYTPFKPFSDAKLISFPINPDESIHSLNYFTLTELNFNLGITNDVMLSASLPYLRKTDIKELELHEESDEPHVNHLGDSKGLGDLNLSVQWRFLHCPNQYAIAALFGVIAPTGDNHVLDNFGRRFEIEHQPGGGAWNPSVGFAATMKVAEQSQLDGNLVYTKVNTGAEATNLGNYANYNIAITQQLIDCKNNETTLLGILELNGLYQNKIKVGDHYEKNTGGHILYLSPGLKYTYQRFTPYVSVGIPIYQHINGEHPKISYRALAGFLILI